MVIRPLFDSEGTKNKEEKWLKCIEQMKDKREFSITGVKKSEGEWLLI